MGIRHSYFLPVGLTALLATLTIPAGAQDQAIASHTADALFEQGKQLLDSGATAEACGRFEESQKLEPAVGTLGMLAWCHELEGKTASAWREYLATAELASKGRDRVREKTARDRASALQLRLPTIRVEVPTPVKDLSVTLSDSPLSEAEWGKAIPVDPGQIPVRACAPGYQCWSSIAETTEDSLSVVVEVPRLEPLPVRATPVAPSKPLTPPQKATPPHRDWVGPALAGGVAVVGLGVGTWFGARTLSKTSLSQSHCDASNVCDEAGGRLRDEARTSSIISNVSFGVALAATALGAVLYVNGRATQPETSRKRSLTVAPEVGASAASLSLRAVF